MKYLFMLLFVAIAGYCAAQGYEPFPIGTGYWRYYGTYHEYGAYAVNNIQLTATNDIVTYNGKAYHKVKLRVSGNSGGSGFPPAPDNIAEGPDRDYIAIREQDKRVYMEYNGQGEYVLFDFNLSVGDMMPLVNSGRLYDVMSTEFSQQYSRINSVDKITIQDAVTGNTKELKRYDLDNGTSVVEGVGGSFGLLLYTSSYDARTLSYTCSGPGVATCSYIWPYGTALYVNEVRGVANNVIYPNPCNDQLTIVTNTATNIRLYNSAGQLVMLQSIDDIHTTIATTALPAGIYLLCMYNAEGQTISQQQVIKAN